ncbi:IMP dehydrogenase [Patescibacteria group bacterium]|nr:IMP dehydrogenase [Patescibacteria group bacterium]
MIDFNKTLFDLNDVIIIPCQTTHINSRKEIDTYTNNNMLPIFTAPMLDVVNNKNYKIFKDNKITPIIPRSVDIPQDDVWVAYSLTEIEDNLSDHKNDKILIDIANGHISRLHNLITTLKSNNNEVMIGNIANPKTYEILCDMNVDFCRCGIGNGAVCTTSANGAVNYPMGSLIYEINSIKKKRIDEGKFVSKVIADGGMKTFKDIIISLALGADYVMLGSMLNKALESSAETYILKITHFNPSGYRVKIDQYLKETTNEFKKGVSFEKVYRGMSTKEVQKIISDKNNLRTSEGIKIYNNVEYTIEQWIDNFKDYLSSAMSYTNKETLENFIGNVELGFITEQSYKRFYK